MRVCLDTFVYTCWWAKVKEEVVLPEPEDVFSPSTAAMIRQLDDSADSRSLVAQLYEQALLTRRSLRK